MATLGFEVSAFLVLCSCAQAPPSTKADAAVLRAELDEWYAAYNAEDADAMAKLYTDDAVLTPAGKPVRASKQAIHEGLAADFAAADCTITGELLETEVSGDIAYMRGVDDVRCTPAAGGDETRFAYRWITVNLRQPDGRWLVHRDQGNRGP